MDLIIDDEYPVGAETDEPIISGDILPLLKDKRHEVSPEEHIGPSEVIIPEDIDGELWSWPEQENIHGNTDAGMAGVIEETVGTIDGFDAAIPTNIADQPSAAIESQPADIYADQEPSTPLELAEDFLSRLAEVVEEHRAREDGTLDEILDEIALKVEEVDLAAIANPEALDDYQYHSLEADIEVALDAELAERVEELEELFTRLIEAVDPEKYPQLAKLFVRLIAAPAETIKDPTKEIQRPAMPHDGTHEIIRQLAAAVKKSDVIQDRLRHIGDSIIQLLFAGIKDIPGAGGTFIQPCSAATLGS